MINFIVENWYTVIWTAAILTVTGTAVYTFIKQPKNVQIAKIQEWLLYAVIEAEKKLGSGTGQIKLRMVYDMFVVRFGSIASVISFEAFSMMVDEALEKMRDMLKSNRSLAEYVETEIGE